MFDDPKKELKRLEEQLLAAEVEKDEEFERFYDEIYEEFGPHEPSEDELLDEYLHGGSQPVRSYPGGNAQPAPRQLEEDRFFEPEPKPKSVKGLVILACLESLGIVGVVVWWLVRLL